VTVRLGVAPQESEALLGGPGVWRTGNRLLARRQHAVLRARVRDELNAYHASHPLDVGAPSQWLRSRLEVLDAIGHAVLNELAREGVVTVTQGTVALEGFAPSLTPQQSALADRLLAVVIAAGTEPPSFGELAGQLQAPESAISELSRWLARAGTLVPVESDRYYGVEPVRLLRARLEKGMVEPREYSPAELREVMDLTRKFLIPFLEYCDREGYTIRGGLGRRLAGTS
jgi:selenocysteine-specific elongation factor